MCRCRPVGFLCWRRLPIAIGGCYFAEDPSKPAWRARIFFDASTDPSVLACEAIGEDPDGFDLATIGCFSAVLRGDRAVEHLLLSDGMHRLRLDVHGGTLTRGPVRLRFAFDGLRAIDLPMLTLRRLAGLDRRRAMPRGLFAAERRAVRWIAAMRANDVSNAGGSQRDVAEALFGSARVREDWSGASDYLRSQARRLLQAGVRMRSGGWRQLLGAKATDG